MDRISRRPLEQLNVRLPATDRDALQQVAVAGGVSLTALLGAIVHAFLLEHEGAVPAPILDEARSIDSVRRKRPHLRRRTSGS